MRKRLLSLLLALCLMLTLLPVPAEAAEDLDGGEWVNLRWSYNKSTYTLTISGEGQMPDADTNRAPFAGYYCEAKKIIIGDKVTSIGKCAFEGFSSITDITIPESVTSIGDEAFANCYHLARLQLGGDVDNIGYRAFADCDDLANLRFSGNVGNIGEQAFYDCYKLSSVKFEGNAGNIGEQAFYNCDKLFSVEFAGDAGNIGDQAFYDCYELSSVEFAGNAGNIGDQAFYDCDKLSSVEFAGDVGNIGKQAFADCRELARLQFSGKAGNIGSSAFYGCNKLSGIEFSGNVGDIESRAFNGCSALSRLLFKGSVGNIGYAAFSDCDKLSNVEFKGAAGDIGNYAFSGCTGLTSFPFTGSAGSIGESSFEYCTGFHRIILPAGVTSIGRRAFYNCENLVAIYIPSTVTSIDRYAMEDTLKDIYFGGTEDQWKKLNFRQQSEGVPVVHYNSVPEFPKTEAGDAVTLQKLLDDGRNAGLTEVKLTSTIDVGDKSLYVHDKSNIQLDLGGFGITTTADPVFEIVGSLTVMDSTVNSKPVVGADNSVIYTGGCISGSGTAIDVLFGGSFTLSSGTVRSTSGDAIVLSGAKKENENLDDIESFVCINNGYVNAEQGTAISVSGDQSTVEIKDGVVRSGGDAVIFISEANPDVSAYTDVTVRGGTLINDSEQFSCGIYQTNPSGDDWLRGGRIIVKNGVGILVRKGWVRVFKSLEISAGGAGAGTLGGSDRVLDAGYEVVLDQGTPDNRSIRCIISDDLSDPYQPKAYPADGTQELKEDHYSDSYTTYSFGPIVYYNVTFDPNGCPGQTATTVRTDSSGRVVFPSTVLSWTGYIFRGWSESPDVLMGTVEEGDTVRRDTTLYAVWTPADKYLITFYESSYSKRYRLTGTDGVLDDWPEPSSGYAGWYTTIYEGAEVYQKDYVFTQDTTVYARWVSVPPPYLITFVFDDGSFDRRQTDNTGKLEDWPDTPEREGYVFKGWGRWPDSTAVASKETLFTSDVTLYAIWRPENGYAVSFFWNDSEPAKETLRTNLNLWASLDKWPRTPLENDRFFVGWYTDPSDGSRMAVDHRFYRDTNAYAHWIAKNDVAAAGLYVVTFDYNGGSDGTGGSGSVELLTDENHRPMFLPYNTPVREGYTFTGWFTALDGGTEVTANTVFTESAAVYAHWTNGSTPDVPEQTYTLTVVDGTGGGTYAAGAEAAITANTAPDGKVFDKWTASGGGTFANEASATTTFTMPANDATVTAVYRDAASTPEQTYTLTVVGGTGGGTYAAGAEAAITANAAPAGKVFDKWTASGGGTFANEASAATTFTMPANDATVTAVYRDAAATPEQTYTLTVTGGTGGGTYAAGAEAAITANAAPAGKVFDKWTASGGGTFANEASAATTFTMPANDATVTAVYKDAAAAAQPAHTIYFDPNGGTVDRTSMVTGTDGRLPGLPIPVYSGYIFNGWYTAPTGGSLIFMDTVFSGNTIVYAQWAPASNISGSGYSPLTEYAVIAPSTIGGTVTVNREHAAKGAAISVTVTPDIGYEMTSLIARDSWWNKLELTDRGGGTYTLTMPDRAVTVNAAFAAAAQQPAPVMKPSRIRSYPGFTDVSAGAWYYDAVRFVCETGLMKGLGSTTFSPNANLSRAQLTQILYNMAGSPAGSVSGFADVASGDWYANAVAWAVSRGIIDGYEGGTFGPYDHVTREEIVVMLWRYAGKPASERELYFTDTAKISTYTLTAVRWAVEKGILSGNQAGALTPKGLATRAEVAQMLKNYFNA